MHPRDARILLICGLGFGDEGKGSVVDFLTRERGASLVVRYNGGPQAAHHVVTEDGITHCFSQFGSGTLVPGVRTFLSRFMLVDPPALLNELAALTAAGVSDAASRLTIDRRAILVTPYHAAMNRIREIIRGSARHGTCGRGVGEAALDAEKGFVVRAGDLENPQLANLLGTIRVRKKDEANALADSARGLTPNASEMLGVELSHVRDLDPEWVAGLFQKLPAAGIRITDGAELQAALRSESVTIFEGAQGVLLDRDYGFFPHVSPTRTTFANAEELISEAGITSGISRIGVTRAVLTRHGEGPFVSENEAIGAAFPEIHNRSDSWQGRMRTGSLDVLLLRYAIRATGGLDGIALTHLDRASARTEMEICSGYLFPNENAADAHDLRLGGLRMEAFFTGGMPARDFVLPDPPSIRRQEELTRLLFQARPLMIPVEPGRLQERITAETGTAIVIESRGPTAASKRFI